MIPVNSVEQLNQVVNNYTTMGYEVKNRTPTSVKLVKDDFSWGVFIILLLLLIIGALIYWAVKAGNKDEVLVTIQNGATGIPTPINPAIPAETAIPLTANNTNANTDQQAVQYCSECGSPIYNMRSKFCPNCGFKLE